MPRRSRSRRPGSSWALEPGGRSGARAEDLRLPSFFIEALTRVRPPCVGRETPRRLQSEYRCPRASAVDFRFIFVYPSAFSPQSLSLRRCRHPGLRLLFRSVRSLEQTWRALSTGPARADAPHSPSPDRCAALRPRAQSQRGGAAVRSPQLQTRPRNVVGGSVCSRPDLEGRFGLGVVLGPASYPGSGRGGFWCGIRSRSRSGRSGRSGNCVRGEGRRGSGTALVVGAGRGGAALRGGAGAGAGATRVRAGAAGWRWTRRRAGAGGVSVGGCDDGVLTGGGGYGTTARLIHVFRSGLALATPRAARAD